MPKIITESAGIAEALTPTTGPGRFDVTLITPGWGSSGYYSPQVLQEAAANKVWAKNTQQHIDHMTAAERAERPEGSISTLASVLLEDARWDGNWVHPETGVKGRLAAESKVFSPWRVPLSEMAEHIGVSITAGADVSLGEVDGQRGKIIEALYPDKLNRVDYVTIAGRGGTVKVLESATPVAEARNVGQWMESRIHSMFSMLADDSYGEGKLTRDERISLSSAIGEALAAFTGRIESDAPQLYERDLWEEPETTSTAEESATEDSPSNPAGANKEKEGASMATTIEESRLTQLEEASSRVPVLEADLTTATERATRAEEALTKANDRAATAIVEAAFSNAGITAPKTAARLSKGYPVAESGELDDETLAADVAESIAELAESNGAGKVHGLGASGVTESKVSESDVNNRIGRAFGRKIEEAK